MDARLYVTIETNGYAHYITIETSHLKAIKNISEINADSSFL